MNRTSPALMGAALVFATILPVAAATALLSVRSAVREGPGNEFRIVGYVDAGQFPLGECRRTMQGEDWCYVDRDVDPGWIHVVLRDPPGGGRHGSNGGPATGESAGTIGGSGSGGGTTKRTRQGAGSGRNSSSWSSSWSGGDWSDQLQPSGEPAPASSPAGDRVAWTSAEKARAEDPAKK